MNYAAYSTEDFLADESFQSFVVESDPAAVHFWQQWLVEHPTCAPTFYEAEAILQQLIAQPRPVDATLKEAELAKLWQSMRPAAQPVLRVSRRTRRWPVALLAVLALLAGVGLWHWNAAPQWASYTTRANEHRQITLPDGSHVTLNGNSVLKTAATWQPGQAREVWLTGEGFFEVQHTAPAAMKAVAAAPANVKFTVHAGTLDVAVLGTQFNVRHRADGTKVVLRSGQIQLSRREGPAEPVLMKPGELVATKPDRPQQPLTKRAVQADFYSAWTSGHLDFDNTPVADIVALLQDGYGLQVTLDNPALLQQKLTGSVPNQDLDVLLNSLGKSLDVKVRREGQHVWLD
jgi:transmembrane sensor